MTRAALTLLLLLAAMAATAHGAPAPPHTGGTLLDARRVTFQALAGLERRGYAVDRGNLRVRVIPKGHLCEGYDGCSTFQHYTGARVVWWGRRQVQSSVLIANGSRTPTCAAFDIATHELLHHALTLRPGVRMDDGYLLTARDGYTDHEYEAEHALIYRLAGQFTDQAERNGRCVDVAHA